MKQRTLTPEFFEEFFEYIHETHGYGLLSAEYAPQFVQMLKKNLYSNMDDNLLILGDLKYRMGTHAAATIFLEVTDTRHVSPEVISWCFMISWNSLKGSWILREISRDHFENLDNFQPMEI